LALSHPFGGDDGGLLVLEYAALNYEGSNAVALTSIGKFSIALTMLFSFLILKEKFSKKMLFGVMLLLGGIAIVAAFAL